ncbi:hypothetical protein Patl1_12858 [Pistacia atlantica]|uniref:Uncharacterized protein n=1 Tax=Pistacia atlantica TaxID=434234 RepID=A0ACC1AY83_9ROSI|nr:hypothetical protein Patl1_12858 [Pistacia atlantica]
MVDVCDNGGDLEYASLLFKQVNEPNVFLYNAMIRAYTHNHTTIVSWTAMISGYSHMGCHADALDVFREMQTAGIEPDDISIVSVLPACAQLGALEFGKWIHMYCDRNGLLRKTYI